MAHEGADLPMPDNNDPARWDRVTAIRILRGPDKEAWLTFAGRHPPTDGSTWKNDPALHYDSTLTSFLQSRGK